MIYFLLYFCIAKITSICKKFIFPTLTFITVSVFAQLSETTIDSLNLRLKHFISYYENKTILQMGNLLDEKKMGYGKNSGIMADPKDSPSGIVKMVTLL